MIQNMALVCHDEFNGVISELEILQDIRRNGKLFLLLCFDLRIDLHAVDQHLFDLRVKIKIHSVLGILCPLDLLILQNLYVRGKRASIGKAELHIVISGLKLFQNLCVGGIAALCLFDRRQTQLFKQNLPEFFGGIDIELTDEEIYYINEEIADVKSIVGYKEDIPKLKEAGIPVIVFCQDFEDENKDLRVCYVGCDDYQCGVVAGEDAIKCLGDEGGKVVCVEGAVGSTPQVQRHNGFHDVVDKVDNIEVLDEQCSPWDRQKAVEIMEDYITRFGDDIDLVFAHDDNLAIGAVEALKAAGLNGKIPVIGYNGMSQAFDLIKSGDMFATLIQPLYKDGTIAVQAMYDYLKGNPIAPAYYDDMVDVYKENVDQLQPEW